MTESAEPQTVVGKLVAWLTEGYRIRVETDELVTAISWTLADGDRIYHYQAVLSTVELETVRYADVLAARHHQRMLRAMAREAGAIPLPSRFPPKPRPETV